MTWWGHIVERWCLCQDACLQETKHGCITNQTTSSLTRASGRSNSKQQICCVFREVQAVEKSESGGQRQKRAKTVYWCKSCKVFLCIVSGNENCFELYHSKEQFWH